MIKIFNQFQFKSFVRLNHKNTKLIFLIDVKNECK